MGHWKQLQLLLNVVTPKQQIEYLNMSSELPGRPYCSHLALKSNNIKFIKRFIEFTQSVGLDLSKQNFMANSLLVENPELLKAVLQANIHNINDPITPTSGETLLHHAARATNGYNPDDELHCQNFECFKLLLKHKEINPNLKDVNGYTPAMRCVVSNKVGFLQHMLGIAPSGSGIRKAATANYKFNSNRIRDEIKEETTDNEWKLDDIDTLQDNFGRNCLVIAAGWGYLGMLKLLLQVGNWKNQKEAALHLCATSANGYSSTDPLQCKNYQCFKLLVEQKDININSKDKVGKNTTALLCFKKKKYEYLNYLMNNHSINWKLQSNSRGENCLMLAAQQSNLELLSGLLKLKRDFNINTTDNKQKTVINYCVTTLEGYSRNTPLICQNYRCFKLLLNDKGVDINIRDEDGNSPAMNCFKTSKFVFLDYLIKQNKQLQWKLQANNLGENCITLAAMQSRYSLLERMKTIHCYVVSRLFLFTVFCLVLLL